MKEFNLNKALERAEQNGKAVKAQLAERLYPESSLDSRMILFRKLLKGDKKMLRIEWVEIICETLNVTPNQLFGYEDI